MGNLSGCCYGTRDKKTRFNRYQSFIDEINNQSINNVSQGGILAGGSNTIYGANDSGIGILHSGLSLLDTNGGQQVLIIGGYNNINKNFYGPGDIGRYWRSIIWINLKYELIGISV